MTSTTQIVNADFHSFTPEDFVDVDAMIVDPPYSPHVHSNATSAGTLGEGSEGWHHRELGFAPLTHEDRVQLCKFAAAVRRWAVIFADHEGAHWWRVDLGNRTTEYLRTIGWTRWSQPQKSGDRPGQQSEVIVHAHRKGKKEWNGPGSLLDYGMAPGDDPDHVRRVNKSLRGDGKHPTEKPLDLMLSLVSWYSSPGETVADPCGGAGTTGLAARLLGRDAIVIERDPKWAAFAEARCTGPLSPRDLERARDWCSWVYDEATTALAKRPCPKGTDKKTRARAERRLGDVERVAGWL